MTSSLDCCVVGWDWTAIFTVVVVVFPGCSLVAHACRQNCYGALNSTDVISV